MYEVILETSGVQQLGWVTFYCRFTEHKVVGDANDSYAFDVRRVRKQNNKAEEHGSSWVVGDVVGCCIDLDYDEISFYRNGVSLGMVFHEIHKMGPGFWYYPTISLSQGERCKLSFGSRHFKYPIEGYFPIQTHSSVTSFATQLLQCLSRLLDMQRKEQGDHPSIEKLRRLKRFISFEELFDPKSHGICEEFFSTLEANAGSMEYIGRGSFLLFMMEVFGVQAPHDYLSLDGAIGNMQISHFLYWNLKAEFCI